MIARLRALLERIRRYVGGAWYRLGFKIFPRVHDRILDRQIDRREWSILHRFAGVDAVVHSSDNMGAAVADWTLFLNQRDRYPGELQLWKNGKLRDSRPAVTRESEVV